LNTTLRKKHPTLIDQADQALFIILLSRWRINGSKWFHLPESSKKLIRTASLALFEDIRADGVPAQIFFLLVLQLSIVLNCEFWNVLGTNPRTGKETIFAVPMKEINYFYLCSVFTIGLKLLLGIKVKA
jgi:hypothetical protein